jgi:hypothetical protein
MQTYRARNPKKSPLWQCAHRHLDAFLDRYPEAYAPQMGTLRPVIPEVVHKFLDCGNLERGFARIRCDECQHEYLLPLRGLESQTVLLPLPVVFFLGLADRA